MTDPRALGILARIGNTPLVPLRAIGAGLGVPILAKCEHLNPGGSLKDRLALAIILDAEQRGFLTSGDTIVEATAGNTGIGLALVAGARGYRVVCVIPEKMSVDKRRALTALGARRLALRPAFFDTRPAWFGCLDPERPLSGYNEENF